MPSHTDIQAQYAKGYNEPLGGNRLWREIDTATDAAASWKAALSDHSHTSYYGVDFIRGMRAYWLGSLRGLRNDFARVRPESDPGHYYVRISRLPS